VHHADLLAALEAASRTLDGLRRVLTVGDVSRKSQDLATHGFEEFMVPGPAVENAQRKEAMKRAIERGKAPALPPPPHVKARTSGTPGAEEAARPASRSSSTWQGLYSNKHLVFDREQYLDEHFLELLDGAMDAVDAMAQRDGQEAAQSEKEAMFGMMKELLTYEHAEKAHFEWLAYILLEEATGEWWTDTRTAELKRFAKDPVQSNGSRRRQVDRGRGGGTPADDKGRNGSRLIDFATHPSAQMARLSVRHVLACRLYTCPPWCGAIQRGLRNIKMVRRQRESTRTSLVWGG
jgi:hypothetical protein